MKSQRWVLWTALVALAVCATMLHIRIHPPANLTFWWPNAFSWTDLILVSLLFTSRSTAILGLLLNSFLAFLGIIMMGDFSISSTLAGKITVLPQNNFLGWLLLTTFPDMAALLADFLVGLALYRAIITER